MVGEDTTLLAGRLDWAIVVMNGGPIVSRKPSPPIVEIEALVQDS